MRSKRLAGKLVLLAAMVVVLTSCGEEPAPILLEHGDCCGVSDWGAASLDSLAPRDTIAE